jgi:hypothetical protein
MIRVESVYPCCQNFCSFYQRKLSSQHKNSKSKFSSFQKALEKEMTKRQGEHYETRV